MEKRKEKNLTKKGGAKKREAAKMRPPQAPPGGGDVPGGIRNDGCWGDGKGKN